MEELVEKYIKKVENAIDIANDVLKSPMYMRTKLDDHILNMRGMSNRENRIFLNELVNSESRYLEIGLNRGSTFVSALYRNEAKYAVGIDNFGGPLHADDIKNHFLLTMQRNGLSPIIDYMLIHENSFNLKESDKEILRREKFDIYFYDGGHSAIDHEKSLTYYYEFLENVFILVVDDWVHPPAIEGTKIGIEKCGLKIRKEWELGHSRHVYDKEKLSWHNKLYVAVMEK